MKTYIYILIFFIAINLNLFSAIRTVTSASDNGFGSLRRTVETASNGDTIVFAPNISEIHLYDTCIMVNRNITIIGGIDDERVVINAGSRRVFRLLTSFSRLTIHNLVLTGARHHFVGGAVRVSGGSFTAINCDFINNQALDGGAI